ncbi:uncharacterized protein SPSC_05283 [Sporisorium scitamineum]|uniref:GATA-type domain-containing protein n=2 Tax=Sporisorium scitamineum TaxID=49012 RepID=A0A127ZH08_9BASI|nr:uncharacterized protein SPSC_05283 [Sporisorium scitamineum]
MEYPSKQGKVTLPPLSTLTSSIHLERRHDQQSSVNDTHPKHQIPAPPSHDVPVRDLGRRGSLILSDTFLHDDRRWPTDRSDPRELQLTAASDPPVPRNRPSPSSSSISSSSLHQPPSLVESPRLIMRGIAEATRPRSSPSPHRQRMQNPTRRSSLALADSSEVDRLVESLYHVQDVNRRLGLNTGSPASPSIVRSPIAAELLHNKIFDELDNMALFSQSRAESVAYDLGFRSYIAPSRARQNHGSSQDTSNWSSSLPPPAVPSGQAGHPVWPPYEFREKTHSSLGRLTLDERPPRSLEHRRRSVAIEREYRDARGDGHAAGSDFYAAHPIHVDPSHRALSRAISFEQPQSDPQRHHHSHQFDHGPAELPRFEPESRMTYDHPMHLSHGPTGALSPMYSAEGRHQQQMELLDRRRLAGKGMKRVRKRKNEHHQECLGCQAKETPEWRKGPMGPRTLCNACGLLYAKLTKRKQQEAEAAARKSGKSAEEIVREREESPGVKQASLEALRAELNLANGMRNRPASSSALMGSASSVPNAPLPPVGHGQSSRFREGAPGHPWPARQHENFPPYAYQASAHRTMVINPHRSNSLGHVESFDQLVGRPSGGATAPSAEFHSRSGPVRPYTGGASPKSRPLPLQTGRQRSHTLQSPARPSVYRADHDRAVSPGNTASQAYGPPAHGAQRRLHPYL